MPKKNLEGIVISDKMNKTIVVKVESIKKHSKYKRLYKMHKSYKVHDEKGEFKVKDRILFQECRPMSKTKRWRAIKKIQ